MVKTAVAVVAAVLLSRVLVPAGFPTFAAIAALLVVQPSVNQSFVKGLERSAGVVLGVLLATLAHLALGDSVWVVLLVIVAAIALAWTLRLTPTSATQVGISGMLVLTTGVVTPGYAGNRILETLIGAAVALIVNALIVPPVLLGPAHLAVSRLGRDTAAAFERIAIGVTEAQDRTGWERDLEAARALRGLQRSADAATGAARESLTMNPRGGRARTLLDRDEALARHLAVLVTRVIGMTRAVRDNASPALFDDPAMHRITTEIARIAADVRRLVARADAATLSEARPAAPLPWHQALTRSSDAADALARPTVAPPDALRGTPDVDPVAAESALTSPVEVVRPNEHYWVVIGSLLEDIRRVREELLGDVD